MSTNGTIVEKPKDKSGKDREQVLICTLRDLFASEAMKVCFQRNYGGSPKYQEVAEESYKMADAMLAARTKR